MTIARNTTIRDRIRKKIAHARPPCWICGQQIDYTLTYPDPGAYVVDHKVPLNRGGTNTLANAGAAHARCNRLKSDRDIAPMIKRSGSLVRPQGG